MQLPRPQTVAGSLAALALALAPQLAHAGAAEFFGFGAASMARGGGGVALEGDGGSPLLNPAAMSGRDGSQFMAAYTLARFNLDGPPPVYWDTNRDGLVTADEDPLILDPEAEYDPADGVMLGISRNFADKVTLGVSMFMPQGRLLRLKTFDPSLPTYFLYQNRAHRYAVGMALAAEPLPGLHLGAGIRVVSRSELSVNLTLNATVAGDPDDEGDGDLIAATGEVHDLTFDLIPEVVPTLGLRWELGELIEPLDGLAIGASFRGRGSIPVVVDVDGQINAKAEDIGDLEPVVAAILLQTQMIIADHYVPMQLKGGLAYTFRERLSAYVDVEHTRWDAMNLSITTFGETRLDSTLADLSEVPFSDINGVDRVVFRNTTGFKAGLEVLTPSFGLPGRLKTGQVNLRAGAGYDPSPLASQSADTALLDADRLIFAGGVGLEHAPPFELIQGPQSWDLFFQYHLLANGQLERPAPEEPRAGDAVDNAPIPIGGGLFAAGLQWSIVY